MYQKDICLKKIKYHTKIKRQVTNWEKDICTPKSQPKSIVTDMQQALKMERK